MSREGRAASTAEFDFDPGSLALSWFFCERDDEPSEFGTVVAEVQPGVYLCEYRSWFDDVTYQRLVSITRMVATADDDAEERWRFYDSMEELRRRELQAPSARQSR